MENISKDVISILQYLLPGFLAAWVFYAFTSHPKPSQFERVIEALIFTLIIESIVFLEKGALLKFSAVWKIGDWDGYSKAVCSTASAILLGTAFAYYSNNDKFHKMMRRLGITRETSFPSEWFGTFLKNVTYIVLHMKDGRRIYGWPIEWPSVADRGHFLLIQASWLKGTEEIPITGVESMLIDVKDVRWVEFMEKTWEGRNGKENLEPAASDCSGTPDTK